MYRGHQLIPPPPAYQGVVDHAATFGLTVLLMRWHGYWFSIRSTGESIRGSVTLVKSGRQQQLPVIGTREVISATKERETSNFGRR